MQGFRNEAPVKSMRNRLVGSALILAATFAPAGRAGERDGCPVTKAPDPPFVPPLPYRSTLGPEFLYGTPKLWTIVYPHWQMQRFRGSKLPFFRQGFDSRTERSPDLTVVARRLDGPARTVRANGASGSTTDGTVAGMFMVTGLEIPTAGCWGLAAGYAPTPEEPVRTLRYTVWVEP